MELQHVEPRKKSVDLSVRPGPDQSAEIPEPNNTEERNDTQGISTSVKRRNEKLLSRLQFLTLCWTLFLIGWNDSSTGPLIPRIREFYGVNNFFQSIYLN